MAHKVAHVLQQEVARAAVSEQLRQWVKAVALREWVGAVNATAGAARREVQGTTPRGKSCRAVAQASAPPPGVLKAGRHHCGVVAANKTLKSAHR